MGQRDVAIIGAACLLPDANDLDTLHDNLRAGRDSVRQPTADRIRYTGGRPDVAYVPLGYLDRIDLFDHQFFGLSLREAELMDPAQRLTLQLVHQAIERSGRAPEDLRGSRTAVILSGTDSGYGRLSEDSDPQQILGLLPGAVAARISYLFDLVGVALVLDTACSGSLTAVALAVEQLRSGAARMAIAGGVSAQPLLLRQQTHVPMRGVESPDGVCRPFDAAANGATGGEGGGIVLLKLLSDALADSDNILAVLKGIASNHNGFRAASMSAPSQVAQTEAITAAWRDAGVDPRTIGYVECHGSGTPLGDVIEVEALRRALLDAGVDTTHCAIGSVKGNLGHLDHAAGMAGLFKALLSVRHGVLYPTPHFRTPNPLIDFTGPVHVNTALRTWTGAAGSPRRAGVSSFGLTGTNVHAVLEQPPESSGSAPPAPEPAIELITVSAKSPAALRRYCQRLADFAERTEHTLRTVAHAMNRCRDDYSYRWAFTAETTTELAAALRSADVPERAVPRDPPVVLLFSGDGQLDDASWLDPDADAGLDGIEPTAAGQLAARQYALYRLVQSLGLTGTRLAGSGAGNLVVRLCRGELSTAEALRAAAGQQISAEVDRVRLGQTVRDFVRDGAVLVELGSDGVLSREMRRLAPGITIVPLVAGTGRRGVLEQLGRVYELGATIDWDRHYEGASVPRIEAPTYPFEPIRCWSRPTEAVAPAVPAKAPIGIAGGTPVATGAETERRIAEIWARVLKASDIGSSSNYFELGGTSIAGITVLREIEHGFGVSLTFADLYEHPTVCRLAEAVDARRRSVARQGHDELSIVPIQRGGRLPLSFGQEQLWYLDQLNPGSPLYNVPHAIRWRGPLDHAALVGALRDLAARHEVLRTCVRSDDGEPYVLDAGLQPRLPLVDFSALPDAERDREVGRRIEAEATTPISLEHGPLLRTTLLKLATDDHVLLATWHHSVFDGWSPVPFFRDLVELYLARVQGRPARLPALTVQYADFAAWHRSWLSGERLERGLAYWRTQLADLRRDELPIDRPRPGVQTHAGGLVEFTVDADVTKRVRDFSRQVGVTTFVTMLAVVDTLIHRWTGQTDVVVGVGTSGRFNPATHELIGYFNNVLPFRTRVRGEESFRELVRRCTTTVAGVLDHEWVPLEKVVSALCGRRDPARHPLFDIAYTHQNAPAPATGLPDVELSLFDGGDGSNIAGIPPGTAKFDLTLGVTDQDGGPMYAYVEYATDLFERSTMERLATWFETLIGCAVDTPDDPIDRLPLSGRQPSLGRSVLRGAEREWPRDRLAVQLVQAHAIERPDHPAVVCAGRTYRYREVNRRANRLARYLVEAGVTAEVAVPVIAERDVDLVVGWLAVAKAGGAYVPVDPTVPAARIEAILDEVDARIAVVSPSLAGLAAGVPHRVAIEATDAGDGADDQDPVRRAAANNLAYVAYTSGSTGRPHGCEVDHGNLANLVQWYRDEGGLCPDDRISQLVSPGFDAAVLEVWAGLCCGASIHFAPATHLEPGALLRWMAEHRITVAMLPTPLAEIVLTEGTLPPDLRLRLLYTGGDQLRARPPAEAAFCLVNIYGPTECTVVSTAGDVRTGPDGVLPDIGCPIANTLAYVLDHRGEQVRPGEVGELYVGGAGVGRGYHRLAAVTAAHFVADPFASVPGARMYRTGDLARLRLDQTIEFCGRADDQVEVRGNRVEPAEIERTLIDHPRVREAVVVPAPAPDGSTRLVAHVAGGSRPPTERELIDWTARALPAYMVPSRVVVRDSLPKTPNGKLDRKGMRALVAPMTTRTTTPAGDHSGTAERVLAGIWADLLGRDRVAPHDNFFELGGDSVMGVRVAARAAKAGVQLTPQQLLQHHTLRELAQAATVSDPVSDPLMDPVSDTVADPVAASSTAVARTRPVPVDRPIPLTPLMHRFFTEMSHGFGGFVVAQVLETTANHGWDAVRAAMEHLVAVHEPLRYRFRSNSLGRRIECADVERARFVDVKILPPMAEEEDLAVVEADCLELRSEVDLERGPVIRARYYDRGRSRNGLILLLIHHAVFDNMGIVAVLDDLDAALAELEAGRPLVAVPRPATWREWTNHLHTMALSDELAGELEYWTGILQAGAAAGEPRGRPDRPGDPAGVVIRVVEPDRVAPALRERGGSSHEAAYCAVACGLARWRGTGSALLMTEGQATPNLYRPTTRAPAVGWFTTVHPLLLPVDAGASARDCLPAVADRIRSVPHDGVGYGILRHLSPHSPAVARLRALPEPEVMAHHMATDTASFDRGIRRLRSRFDLHMRLKKADTAGFGIVITTSVHEGSLTLGVAHDRRFHLDEMTALADHILAALLELA